MIYLLPTEIVTEIMVRLSSEDLLILRQVKVQFNQIYRNDFFWKHKYNWDFSSAKGEEYWLRKYHLNVNNVTHLHKPSSISWHYYYHQAKKYLPKPVRVDSHIIGYIWIRPEQTQRSAYVDVLKLIETVSSNRYHDGIKSKFPSFFYLGYRDDQGRITRHPYRSIISSRERNLDDRVDTCREGLWFESLIKSFWESDEIIAFLPR